MQSKILIQARENSRLIIFFTGWSTDWHILEGIEVPIGYDLICCFDYSVIDWKPLSKVYDEVIIIAWSFGIGVVEKLLSEIKIENVTGLYAVNGSRFPVDDVRGIPEKIFESTLTNLNERILEKFHIRIVGGRKGFLELKEKIKRESGICKLKEELSKFKELNKNINKTSEWDYAFLSEDDKIFPLSNLQKAWKDTPYEILKNSEHYPDFQKIFNLIVKDKDNIGKNFRISYDSYSKNAKVQNAVAERIKEILSNFKFENVLELGGGTGELTQIIQSHFHPGDFTVIDLTTSDDSDRINYITGDIEKELKKLPSDYYDLVISGSTMQWLHSPGKALKEIQRILKPGGRMIFSTFIKGNFNEIYNITGKTLLYLNEDQWKLLTYRANLKFEMAETNTYKLLFDDVASVFQHLKATGVNSLSGKTKTIREMKELMKTYPKEEGGYPLTYETIILSGIKNI